MTTPTGERAGESARHAGHPAMTVVIPAYGVTAMLPDAIDSVFLTGGSVKLAHVHKAITKAVPQARIVEGDIFGAVGKGLTLEALRRYGPAN